MYNGISVSRSLGRSEGALVEGSLGRDVFNPIVKTLAPVEAGHRRPHTAR